MIADKARPDWTKSATALPMSTNARFTGPRVFFENAGGALTLKSVVETSAKFAAIPDNQGRDNPASHALVDIINKAKAEDAGDVQRARRPVLRRRKRHRTAVPHHPHGHRRRAGRAARSSAPRWSIRPRAPPPRTGRTRRAATTSPCRTTTPPAPSPPQDYARLMTPDVRVATIMHTSPVTGMGVDVAAVATAIRAVSPDCYIIVDGIQHASHGQIDIAAAGIDGYAVSPYKVFSRHGYGVGWASDRLTALPHERLIDGPETNWEFGTRDTGAYATFSDVVDYLDLARRQVHRTAPTTAPASRRRARRSTITRSC